MSLLEKAKYAIERLKSIKNKERISKVSIEMSLQKEKELLEEWENFFSSEDFPKFKNVNELELVYNPGIGGIGNFLNLFIGDKKQFYELLSTSRPPKTHEELMSDETFIALIQYEEYSMAT